MISGFASMFMNEAFVVWIGAERAAILTKQKYIKIISTRNT
jgi:hypothetical protein